MTKNEIVRQILKEKLSNAKKRNPSYSIRRLAMDLEISSGSLVDFLNGKREFSAKLIYDICTHLKVPVEEFQKVRSAPQFTEDQLPIKDINIKTCDIGLEEIEQSLKVLYSKLKKLEKQYPGNKEFKIKIEKNMEDKLKIPG